MKKIVMLVLFCFALAACSNQSEVESQQNQSKSIFKVKAEYSGDVGGEFAKNYWEYQTIGSLFKDLSFFEDVEYTDSEDLQLSNLLDMLSFARAVANTTVELEMVDLMERHYSVLTDLKVTKLNHQKAKEYEAIGVKDKEEYLDFEKLSSDLEAEATEILDEFNDYIE